MQRLSNSPQLIKPGNDRCEIQTHVVGIPRRVLLTSTFLIKTWVRLLHMLFVLDAWCPCAEPRPRGCSTWASLAKPFPASSVLAREGAGCGSVGDVPGAWLASAPLSPSLWT